ncbi:MAG: class I SAM-dependent methyltransferase [Methanosarcina sp.]|jgi:ubiquinone/menaquinone biosynthesis C-methylase UbiE|uniref:class I SAM-dependent methyltransferase n=1 Tax=Methanosarcina sp. TaxID=2213 RepID=UPI003BB64013
MANKSTDICPYQRAWTLDNWLRRLLQNPYKIVGEYIKEGQVVMDLGCGPGFFSLEMAKLVGEKGKVISVDIQDEMLQIIKNKSEHEGLSSRIILHKAQPEKLGISEMVDFALAFYMVHEVPDKKSFLSEVASHLKPDGRFLIVEPKFHVSKSNFSSTLELARSVGLEQISEPKFSFNRAVLLKPLYEA